MLSEQLIVAAIAAAGGGVGSWVILRVEVAVAAHTAREARASAAQAHDRITRHVEVYHSMTAQQRRESDQNG